MTDGDRGRFAEMIAAVYEFKGKLVSQSSLDIWWACLKAFDLEAVRDALGRHFVNPDTGQFLPTPADVVKMLGGSTLDSALVALHKVETAFSSVGVYRTVVFDDPLIHAVIEEMGGWVACGTAKSKDWEFRRTEFLNRYRSYRSRSETPAHVPMLVGIADAENLNKGRVVGNENTVFVGDASAAQRVLAGGQARARIGLTPMALAVRAAATLRIEEKS